MQEDVEGLYEAMLKGEEFSTDTAPEVDAVLGAMNEHLSKLKFTVEHHERQRVAVKGKIPDMEGNVKVIERLQALKEEDGEMTTHFELADAVFAKATCKAKDLVCLWLGANVMVEYTYDEAMEMLASNLGKANLKLKSYNEDLQFLREQIILTEVNIARVYNHSVRLKRKMVANKVKSVPVRFGKGADAAASGAASPAE